MNEFNKEEEREEGKKTGKQDTKTKKMKSAEDDQYRVVIQKESNDALEELVRRTNDGFEGGEVTKSDVVNLLISNHAKSFSDSDVKNLRLLHFDEKKALKALLRKAGDDGDLPSEIKKVLRVHLAFLTVPNVAFHKEHPTYPQKNLWITKYLIQKEYRSIARLPDNTCHLSQPC